MSRIEDGAPLLPMRFSVCKEDFSVWDRVLERAAGMRLETMSRQDDGRDAVLMRLSQWHRVRPPWGWTQEMTCGFDTDGLQIHSGGNLRARDAGAAEPWDDGTPTSVDYDNDCAP